MKQPIVLSHLAHLWLIDIDGTIVKHNGHLESGDELLPGVKAFWDQIPEGDHIVLLTARDQAYTDQTVELLRVNDLRYNQILFGLPTGERIVINDQKPSGLCTAHAISTPRDYGLVDLEISINKEL